MPLQRIRAEAIPYAQAAQHAAQVSAQPGLEPAAEAGGQSSMQDRAEDRTDNGVQPNAGLAAEGIRLREGRTLLNRSVDAASALIVVEGALRIGVLDDDALLTQGEGVLLPAGASYSVRAEQETVAFVFSTRPE